MSTTLEVDTLLVIDVGNVNTRASLFDVVDGRYRLVATGRAFSTGGPPLFDVSEGVRLALDQVRAITGRRMVDESEALIMPSTRDGSGTDLFVATTSAGPNLRTVLVGLMPGISLQSARRLAVSTYLDVVEEIGLMDRRRPEEQIDLILASRPDLMLIVGGTDGGASASVVNIVRAASLAAGLLPEGQRPRVVFAGNQHLAAEVVEAFGDRLPVVLAPNLRPSLEDEELGPARRHLAEVIAQARSARIAGFDELFHWTGGHMIPTAEAFGRVVRYLSRFYERSKGVLGIDLGASQTTVAAAFDGDLRLTVRTDLGLGAALPGLLKHSPLDKVTRWLPVDMGQAEVRDYIYNKALHPAAIPIEGEELHLEYALARQLIRTALLEARSAWPAVRGTVAAELLPPMEPVLATGGALARAPRPGYAALVLLDALQPVGVTTLVLDPYSLAPALGAAAAPLPMATVQVLESGSFVSLGTVVSLVGRGRPGRPALRLRLDREGGEESVEGEIRFGQLVVLPLGQGQHGRLTLRPERGFDAGFGTPGKAGVLRVSGGAVGLIIDARGRPIQLPSDPVRRQELNMKWLWDIGGQS
ncbi:MAG: glutamate mutase L [Chloroflexota bacterium]